MATQYYAPGVHPTENRTNSYGISNGVHTSVGGLIGFTEDVRNGAEKGKPQLITSWTQFKNSFGKPNSDGYTNFGAYLPHAVKAYFNNGGGKCYIASIGTQLPKKSQSTASVQILTGEESPSLNVSLRESQAANGAIQVVIGDSEPRPVAEKAEGEAPPNTGEYFFLELRRNGEILEHYDHLTMNQDAPTQVATYVVEALESSEYVRVIDEAQSGQPLQCRPMNGEYELSLSSEIEKFYSDMMGNREEGTGLEGLFEVDAITMVAFPDLMLLDKEKIMDSTQVHGVMETMISRCTTTTDGDIPGCTNRMIVLDSPHDCVKPQQIKHWLENEFNHRSMYAALYYPWVKVANPRNLGRPISVPPCGHMMGVWAHTDEKDGTHEPPANKDGVPTGIIGLNYEVNHREQELLNPIGINCIRNRPNRGINIWGARTLAKPEQIKYRYINVRRTMNFIEASIAESLEFAVLKPNNSRLWGQIRRAIRAFLFDLWQEGALVGKGTDQAYTVICDRSNNPPETIDQGRVYVEIEVAIVRPAEFIILNFAQNTRESMAVEQ